MSSESSEVRAPQPTVRGGIEHIEHAPDDPTPDYYCARCGSEAEWLNCANCGGEGLSHHDCGEDCCCCIDPEANVTCYWCRGEGGSRHCTETPEWCEAHPIAGREGVTSTALRAEAWSEY